MLRSSPMNESNTRYNVNVKAISELLSDFDEVEPSFTKWEWQVRLLRVIYKLDDKSVRIIIILYSKEKAKSWFYARPKNVERNNEDLLSQFEIQKNVRSLKKERNVRQSAKQA